MCGGNAAKKLSDRLESIATQREQSDEPSEEHTATTASQLLDRTPSPKVPLVGPPLFATFSPT
jgi:hypothetical protein